MELGRDDLLHERSRNPEEPKSGVIWIFMNRSCLLHFIDILYDSCR